MGESLQFLRINGVFESDKQQGPASAGICAVCGFGQLDGDEQVEQEVVLLALESETVAAEKCVRTTER